MVHYSGVSSVDFDQVNTEWMRLFRRSRKNLEKSHTLLFKSLSPTCKCYKGYDGIVPELKHLSLILIIIRIWYFLRLLLLFDTQLKQVLQIYTNKSFSSSSYSCIPMKVCESEVYSKHIAQPLDTYCSRLFSEKFESWYACSHQNLYKICEGKNSIQLHSYIWNKDFII